MSISWWSCKILFFFLWAAKENGFGVRTSPLWVLRPSSKSLLGLYLGDIDLPMLSYIHPFKVPLIIRTLPSLSLYSASINQLRLASNTILTPFDFFLSSEPAWWALLYFLSGIHSLQSFWKCVSWRYKTWALNLLNYLKTTLIFSNIIYPFTFNESILICSFLSKPI